MAGGGRGQETVLREARDWRTPLSAWKGGVWEGQSWGAAQKFPINRLEVANLPGEERGLRLLITLRIGAFLLSRVWGSWVQPPKRGRDGSVAAVRRSSGWLVLWAPSALVGPRCAPAPSSAPGGQGPRAWRVLLREPSPRPRPEAF